MTKENEMGFLKKMLKKSIGGKIAAKLGDPLAKKMQGGNKKGNMGGVAASALSKMAGTTRTPGVGIKGRMGTGGPGQVSGPAKPAVPRPGGMGDRIKPRKRNQQRY